jgi:2-C-methyl-D-erythritol 4-phosphate cytidylyltransferase
VVVAPVPSPVADRAAQFRTVPVSVVPGGATRHLSERAGLAAVLAAGPTELLAFHDAARPFLTTDLIASLVAAVADADGAVPVVSAGETLFQREGDRAHRLASQPVRVQTPQVFRTDVVVEAFTRPGAEHDADTSETVARTGVRIAAVPGDEHNLKITHPIDLARSRAISEGRP